MKKKKPTSTSQMPKISSETTACLNRTYNAHTRERKREFAKEEKKDFQIPLDSSKRACLKYSPLLSPSLDFLGFG